MQFAITRRAWIRPLRLSCGLILFAFLLSHFSNHMLGLVSLEVMERGRQWFLAPWRHPVGEWVLLVALLAHWLLGLWLIYRRRTLRMPAWEAVQIVFGLAVPPLLVYHAIGIRMLIESVGTEALYTWVILNFWVLDPIAGLRQLALFSVAWIHGCIGLHFWLRIRSWYARYFPFLLTTVVLVPIVALLGATQAGREIALLASEPDFIEKLRNGGASNSYTPDAYGADPYASDSGAADGYGSDSYASDSGAADGYGSDSYASDSVDSGPYASDPYASGSGSSNPYGSESVDSYGIPTAADSGVTLAQVRDWLLIAVWALLGLTLTARLIRNLIANRKAGLRVSYLSGKEVRVPVGWSLLEASRYAGIPHASVCGGRARCSTCRVRVAGDPALQPAPEPLEQRVLERINAAPNVRLACQLRPTGNLSVTPLLPVAIGTGNLTRSGGARGGEEREVTILFADLRGFTRVAERKLPYDVVFLLNRYFEAVGGAVAHCGGIANQYTGDGVMALFGVSTDPEQGCRQAVVAAGEMITRVEALSKTLGTELDKPLRIGIGIHIGSVVVGEMGYAGTRYLTAVGDTVNTTSRLEALTKEYNCELIVSEEALARVGLPNTDYPHHELLLRNRDAPLRVVVVDDARALARRFGHQH